MDLADLLLAAESDILDAAIQSLEPPRTAEGAPECTRISHGEPTPDCAMLTVHATVRPEFITTGKLCALVTTATFCVTLLRCVTAISEAPGKPVPSCTVLDAEAQALAIDGWALWTGLARAWKDGTLLATPPLGEACESLRFEALTPMRPTGLAGLAGWRMCMTLTMPGAASTLGS